VAILSGILNSLLVLTSLFLICLVLIQRGKGGGLAGAFGGTGGSSAFGTKAGDVFTRVTMIVAGFWILLSMLLVILANRGGESAWGTESTSTKVTREAPAVPGGKAKDSSKGSSSAPKSSPTTPAPSGSSTPSPVGLPAIPDDEAPKSK
jgi:preprotein translocase subunit SecG